ncbi:MULTISPECIES: hypothetical protein [Rhizobium]|uniref:Uncharacterized protein n=1 Tax=Rhizobium paranaense TaxID=1650438 RepID=A0A7W9D1Y6_9HYPH|nr:hypothetical protein [Rhizobium paranaense]MBB5574698.1 hypothetical protein [Rhizobium paranaense]
MSTSQSSGPRSPLAAATLPSRNSKLATATRNEGVTVLGPSAHGD